jgi:hypothetical protein
MFYRVCVCFWTCTYTYLSMSISSDCLSIHTSTHLSLYATLRHTTPHYAALHGLPPAYLVQQPLVGRVGNRTKQKRGTRLHSDPSRAVPLHCSSAQYIPVHSLSRSPIQETPAMLADTCRSGVFQFLAVGRVTPLRAIITQRTCSPPGQRVSAPWKSRRPCHALPFVASSRFYIPGCRYLPSAKPYTHTPICFVSSSLSPTR